MSYRWLFEMDDHVDGFTATGHDYLMLDSFFQEPDLFLAILAEYDTEAIRVLTLRMHSAISSQREYDLYTQLLLAISARTDLTAAEEQALVLLAEAVPGDFPYEVPPVAASPEPTGNLPENVQGADPELPNGVVTIPPANTLAHTHIYTTTTIKTHLCGEGV